MAHETRLYEWAYALNWLINSGTMGRAKDSERVPYDRFLPEGLRVAAAVKERKPTKAQLKAQEIKHLREFCLFAEETPGLITDDDGQRRLADAKAKLAELGKPWVPTADRKRTPPPDADVLTSLVDRATEAPRFKKRD